jgi:hypothetical protein
MVPPFPFNNYFIDFSQRLRVSARVLIRLHEAFFLHVLRVSAVHFALHYIRLRGDFQPEHHHIDAGTDA